MKPSQVVLETHPVFSGSYDKTIRVWDVAKLKEIKALTGHKEAVRALIAHKNINTNINASESTESIGNKGEDLISISKRDGRAPPSCILLRNESRSKAMCVTPFDYVSADMLRSHR